MLKREDLEKMRAVVGFNTGQAEKDYLQHLFLLFLSRHIKNEIVFKGGTALQKAFGLNRFSIDLDFTLHKEIDMKTVINEAAHDISNFGFKAVCEHTEKRTGITSVLKLQGPLYDGRERTLSSLRIEVSTRERVVLEPVWREIVPVYNDLQPYIICVMHLEEIFAEKVRAIMTRTKARDVYDLWFLLKKGVMFNQNLAAKKLEYYGKSWDLKDFHERIGIIEGLWRSELGPLVLAFPDFIEVKQYILEKISGSE